ncbi:MAG: DALR domain-containing protein, partial [Acidobacteriota bacterium]
IECSAMSMEHLGESFDIHGGGEDLIFPHHDCEIAQSEAATEERFVRYWIHNGFVQINQEKMSKSLGNFFTVREIFEKSPYGAPVTAEALRYFLLATHYRSPVDFSDDALWEAKRALDRFYDLFQRLDEATAPKGQADALLPAVLQRFGEAFHQAMDDDFNTPAAIAQLQVLRGELNRVLESGLSRQACENARKTFREFGRVLGLFQLSVKDWQHQKVTDAGGIPSGEAFGVPGIALALTDEEIERQVAERNEARRRKDFKKADEIRAELASFGITVEDRPDGTSRWKR